MAAISGPSYIPRGTKAKCTMGATEQALNVLVDHGIIATASREPLMNANDHVPMVNIMPFGFCKKGMPCMPVTPLAWVDVNKKHIIDGAPALTEDSKLACFHGGVITIVPLDAGSAEEGDRNENAEDTVEEIGSIALNILAAIVTRGKAGKFSGMKGVKKNSVSGGGNKGKGSGGDVSKKAKGNFGGSLNAQDIPNSTKDDLLKKLPSDWKYTQNNGFVHVRDAEGNIRMRIDPPDKVTKFDHVHLYDQKGNPLDVNLNIIDRKSPNAHIPIKKLK